MCFDVIPSKSQQGQNLKSRIYFSNIHIEKQSKYQSINEWIKKMWYMHTIECYGDFKKENPEIPDNTDEP